MSNGCFHNGQGKKHMTDVVTCDHCGSDTGFMVESGRVYCKACKQEHKPETPTMGDHWRGMGLWPKGLRS